MEINQALNSLTDVEIHIDLANEKVNHSLDLKDVTRYIELLKNAIEKLKT